MNSITYRIENYEEQIVVEPPEEEEHSNEEITETVLKTRLLISVNHKTAPEMSLEYGFSQEQKAYLDEVLSDRVLYYSMKDSELKTVAMHAPGN